MRGTGSIPASCSASRLLGVMRSMPWKASLRFGFGSSATNFPAAARSERGRPGRRALVAENALGVVGKNHGIAGGDFLRASSASPLADGDVITRRAAIRGRAGRVADAARARAS